MITETLTGWHVVLLFSIFTIFFFMITYGWIVLVAWAIAFESKWRKPRYCRHCGKKL